MQIKQIPCAGRDRLVGILLLFIVISSAGQAQNIDLPAMPAVPECVFHSTVTPPFYFSMQEPQEMFEPPAVPPSDLEPKPRSGFQWKDAIKQSAYFLGIMHGFRMATEKGSRAELVGPFFKDYFRSVRNLRGWDDGDPFLVNYIGHPMQGAVSGFIQVQNDSAGRTLDPAFSRAYRNSRLKALGWAALNSAQFEIGLLSEASIGNIGIRPYRKQRNPMAWVDLVVTPTMGTAWLVGEDMLDRYLVARLENLIDNRIARVLMRTFLNPTRSMANIVAGKRPWHRAGRF